MQQFLGDGQVHSGGVGIDVPQEGSEVHEPAVRINALPVPAKQSGYGKGMPSPRLCRTPVVFRKEVVLLSSRSAARFCTLLRI